MKIFWCILEIIIIFALGLFLPLVGWFIEFSLVYICIFIVAFGLLGTDIVLREVEGVGFIW